ncbi:hypothetical protein ISS03_05130 [Patescibacteria group bacterium]|nr:hypothetical protein [Patescibacteria group bacterium]
MDILSKINKSNLCGRGGANFSVYLKWLAVKNATNTTKYVICNAAESELLVNKDGYILSKYPEAVVDGMFLAINFLKAKEGIIYLKPEYYKKLSKQLTKLIGNRPISLFKKTGSYLCGEETTLLNDIEGKRKEPRMRPPFPTISGLWDCPTLVNNVETFYYISKIANDNYNSTHFITIAGDTKNKGTFELPLNLSINNILKNTNNFPKFNFFVQINGGASGEFLIQDNLNKKLNGTGSIIIYNTKKTNKLKLLKKIVDYFHQENCDKCVPCREGVYRIHEMLKNKNINQEVIDDLLFTMKNTSFCALGKSVSTPLNSLMNIK